MSSGGASERRLGELAEGKQVVIATKFPPGWLSKTESFGEALEQSLARLQRSTIDLSAPLPFTAHLDFLAHGAHGRRA
jgi:aryl-alcohol dehydrogenase-like predicted oxidoreductase